ncbi:hypothetical protein ABBQ38_000825 [Trebouxia sp. C0009 RCD-2024]
MEVSTPTRARCTISRTISATSGLWQSSTVADGCLRCLAIFCIEHLESVAIHSFKSGLHSLSATSSGVHSTELPVYARASHKPGIGYLFAAAICEYQLIR